MEKLWAGPLLASRYLRNMAVLGMRRRYNCATTGERTKFMHFADPLSRVWEKGVHDASAMVDFGDACKDAGILEGMKEVKLTQSFLDAHVSPQESFAAASLRGQVKSMIRVADSKPFETVGWDPAKDEPMEHCLRELPGGAGEAATGGQRGAAPAEPVEERGPTTSVPEGPAEGAPAETGENANSSSRDSSSNNNGSSNSSNSEPGLPQQSQYVDISWVEPAGGRRQQEARVWSVRAAQRRTDAAREAWQREVKLKYYTQAPTRLEHQATTNQTGFSESELEPLLQQSYKWKRQPTLTAICYGVLGSAMGWAGEGFKLVAGSEIEPWCVDHASRLFPGMIQLGDLEQTTAEAMPESDMLIVGTTCTAVSVLGLLRGLADIKMKHMLMVARLAVQKGYKAMVFEMVPNILGYDAGAIQLAFENIFRAAGYEVSRRVECLYQHGGGAVRERLYTIVTNPCYGSHAELNTVTAPLRQESDPCKIADTTT